ncbi:MAG: alternative ribosome rescue aminoacyl-tRNA hydrolase ArfB [Psychroserpens sp.]|uniref:alternative ribosome rescue aminoacyl-tRNA hydrolase ArfB n=1 Tax=Psychroserpens sp. TaxID=2020870 RepID=UPI003CC19A94
MLDDKALVNELNFKAIRSSGAGGQHVNKTSSKVELTFDLDNSQILSEAQIALLKTKLESKLTKDNVLIMQCGESRSQFRNKAIIIKRFIELIRVNLIVEKKRRFTKVPRAAIRRRLKIKRQNSEKKSNRRPPEIE